MRPRMRQVGADRWHFNPRTPYGMRLRARAAHAPSDRISIHAPRTGCDKIMGLLVSKVLDFNPRTPYGMRRRCASKSVLNSDFNPRTPYGMRLRNVTDRLAELIFQSTHPVRDATITRIGPGRFGRIISIHAPRTGCDQACADGMAWLYHFNPRTPYGMRRHLLRQSEAAHEISIHAPRTGCDIEAGANITVRRHFNPRTPYGMRREATRRCVRLVFISIHAPRTGCDGGIL